MNTNLTERFGNSVVAPLTLISLYCQLEAAVSIRRGKYDRIFRFIELFDSPSSASKYALIEGRSMVLSNQLS